LDEGAVVTDCRCGLIAGQHPATAAPARYAVGSPTDRHRVMRKIWARYVELLEQDFSTQIFDNIKNLLVCALLFAAGTSALRADYQQFIGVLVAGATGWGLIGVSAILMFLNVSDGIRRLGKLRYHVAIQVLVSLVYLLIAARLVEVVWAFRAA
jgi:hypothetical protein